MDERTFECLQVGEILAAVAGYCQTSLGRRLVESLRPAAEREEVEARLRPVTQTIELADRGREFSIDAIEDPTPLWDAVGPEGHSLDPAQLARAASFLEVVRRADSFLRSVARDAPALAALGERLAPQPLLERDLRRAIQPDGEVSDHASADLGRIRGAIAQLERRVRQRVDALVGELNEQGHLQDSFATVRGGRYVFPVRAASKRKLSGIVHGASNTGETLYIEPAVLVEMTNDLEELRQSERTEIHRICRELTARLRPHLAAFRADTERLGELDGVAGRARAARRLGWHIPQILDSGPPRLLDAHHPILHIRNRESSVGVRMALDAADRVVLISGPNAGGKTTLMKTLGLAAVLTQSGVPTPLSPDSRLPVFNEIWADIGDAQDVAAGQSTFSAHARRLSLILQRARANSLVLLDELGTATDPSEGTALAQAALEALRKRGGLTVATCHLTPLKQWAHETQGARNASFTLEERTHVPTFHLLLDVPGTSEALIIAEREGVAPEVIERARGLLHRGEVDLAALLSSLGRRERSLAQAEDDVRRRLQALTEQESLARRRADELREERRRWREGLARERERQLAGLREEIEKRIAALPAREAALDAQRAALSQARREIQAQQRDAEAEHRRAQQALPPMIERDEIKPGREVYVLSLRESGTVRALLANGNVQVVLERGLVVEAPMEGLASSAEAVPQVTPPPAPAGFAASMALADDIEFGGKKQKKSKKIKRQKALSDTPEDLLNLAGPPAPRAAPKSAAALKWHPSRARPVSAAKRSALDRSKDTLGRDVQATGELGRDAQATGNLGQDVQAAGVRFRRKGDVPWQIDLHGMRVEEALETVDKFLDDAVLAEFPFVKLCHGRGTGTLARAIHESLRNHPLVTGFRFGQEEEGGYGVTVVDLR